MAETPDHPRPEAAPSATGAPAHAATDVGPASTATSWLQQKLEAVHHWMESGGFGSNVLDFILIWWRKLGTPGIASLALAVVLPAGGYASLAYSTSHSIPGWIGDFGVQFEAEDWDIHVLSLKSVARNVKLRRDAKSEPVLTAAEVEFDGSLWSVLSTLWGGRRYHQVTIRHGEVLIERSLTGDYNWADFLNGVPVERRQAAVAGAYSIDGVYLENMRFVYLEHVPGGSGGGVVRSAQARVIFDAVNASLLNLRAPAGPGDRPTQLSAKARLADGIIEVKGDAGILPSRFIERAGSVRAASLMPAPAGPAPRQTPATGIQTVSGATSDGTTYLMKVYVENLAAGAYGTMAAATTQIVPSRGTVNGNVVVEQAGATFTCTSQLVMDDVAFAPNPKVVVTPAKFNELSRTLAGFRNSGPFDACGDADARVTRASVATRGTASAMLATFNAQATHTAPPSIRAITARDQDRLAGVVANALYDDLLADAPGDNTVTRGLKSVGRGIKRLFGGK